jgi:hypothetical protein
MAMVQEREEKDRGIPLLLGGFVRALLFYAEKFSQMVYVEIGLVGSIGSGRW